MIDNTVVSKGIEYILENLNENITIEDVAGHCYISPSRFSAIFKEQTGESVYSFIKRLKLEQSAFRLKLEKQKSITDIGQFYGYSASNYSWAFSKYHKVTPSEFRRGVSKESSKEIIKRIDDMVRIENKPDYEVMYERFIGNYSELKDNWCIFMEKYKDDIDEDTIFFERTFDDPSITDENHCIYDICMTTKNLNNYENTCILNGGKFVVYPYKGYIDGIVVSHQELIGSWFPAKKLELDERYAYNQYRLVREDLYMEFDICIPIKE